MTPRSQTIKRWLSLPQSRVYIAAHTVLLVSGFAIVRLGGLLWEAVGAGVIATAIAGYILFLNVAIEQDRKKQLEILDRFGFTNGFDARAAAIRAEYDIRLANARDGIDVLGFGLRQLREDYIDQFATWAACCRVRILLIDPDFPRTSVSYARQRDVEERVAPGTIGGEVQAFLQATQDVRRQYPDRFQVKLYRCIPSVNIFRVDGDLFWGPYLVHEYSRNTPTFIVRQGGIMYRKLQEHFNKIWNDSSLSIDPA